MQRNELVANPFGWEEPPSKKAKVAAATETKRLYTGHDNYGFNVRQYTQGAILDRYARQEAESKKLITQKDERANPAYSQSTWELDQEGYRGALSAVRLMGTQAWASTKKRGVEAYALPDTLEAGEENQYPQEVLDAYNRFRQYRDVAYKHHLPQLKELREMAARGDVHPGFDERLAKSEESYRNSLPTQKDMDLLNSQAYRTVKDWRTQSETRIPIGEETFLTRMVNMEKARLKAEKKVGNPQKGIPDMLDSQKAVNPVLQERRQKDIQEWRAQSNIRALRAKAGDNVLANALVDATDVVGTTIAGAGHLGALAQDLSGMAPDLVLGPYSAAAGAALQAGVTDNLTSRRQYMEQTGNYAPDAAGRNTMAAMTGLNFAANFAENMLVGNAIRGRAATAAPPSTGQILKQAVVGPIRVTRDVAKAYGANAAAGYVQGAITSGWGALSDMDHDVAVENAALGGLLGGAAVAPSTTVNQTVGLGKQVYRAANEQKTKTYAKTTASFEDNINPDSDVYDPAEAINKQVTEYGTAEDDARPAIISKAGDALRVAQTRFDQVNSVHKQMQDNLDYVDQLKDTITQDRASIMDVPEADRPAFEQQIAEAEQLVKDIEASYPKEKRKQINEQYAETKGVLDKANEAYRGLNTLVEHMENTKATGAVAKDHAETLSNAKAAPEAKAEATAHVRSFPMAYKPEQLHQFADDLTNDLTDAQRTVLRELADERVQDHMSKGVEAVSGDLVKGGNGYRKLNDYFTMYSEAARIGDSHTQDRLNQEFQRLDSSFQKKSELAQRIYKIVSEKGGSYQIVRDAEGGWKINRGRPLSEKALRRNGGIAIHAGSGGLVRSIQQDADNVTHSHSLFKKMQAPEFTQVPEVATPTADPVTPVTPEPIDPDSPEVVVTPDDSTPVSPEETPVTPVEESPSAEAPKAPEVSHEARSDVTPTPTPEVEVNTPETHVEAHESVGEGSAQKDTEDLATPDEAPAESRKTVESAATVTPLKGATPEVLAQERKASPFNLLNLVRHYFKQGSSKAMKPLAGIPDMMNTVLKADDLRNQVEEALGIKLNDRQMKHIEDFVSFHDGFAEALDKVFLEKTGKNEIYKHQDLVQFLAEDGKLPANVKTALAISAFNWLIENGSPAQFELMDKEILKLLGTPKDGNFSVPAEVRQVMGTIGSRQNVVISMLGQRTSAALQLKAHKKGDVNYQGRLDASLGALTLHTMDELGYVVLRYVNQAEMDQMYEKVTGDKPTKTPDGNTRNYFVRVNHRAAKGRLVEEHGLVKEFRDSSKQTEGVLNKIFGAEDPLVRPELTAPTLDQQSIRNSKLGVPSKTIKNANKAMKDPYAVREPVVGLFKVLYENAEASLKDMLDINDADSNLNRYHISVRDNMRAKFRNEWLSLERALEYMGELEQHKKEGKYPNIFFRMVVWSNQRIGFASNMFNVQTSQIHRAMAGLAAHHTKIEGTELFNADGSTTSYGTFIRAVAAASEGVADAVDAENNPKMEFPADYKAGKTVDKAPSDLFLPVFMKYLARPEVQEAIDAMGRTLKASQEGNVPERADVDLIAAQVKEMGMGPQSIVALVELARHKEAGDKPFVTTMGIESDGVTNGPAIANLLAGTLTRALARQFGLVPREDSEENQDKSYHDIKRRGEADYYQTFGDLQKEFINKLLGTDENSVRGKLNQSMSRLAGGFGGRKSAKNWATPFNYSAGFDALKKALSREMIKTINTKFADIANKAKTNEEGAKADLAQLVSDLNEALNYHNKHMQVRSLVESPEKVIGQLAVIEAEFKMRFPNRELPPRPTDLRDGRALANYANAMTPRGKTKLELTPDEFLNAMNIVITANNKELVRTRTQVDLVDISPDQVGNLADFELTSAQVHALGLVSAATHGMASEHAIKVAAADYIQSRDLNIKMHNAAFNAYNILRKAMIQKRLEEKRKAGLIPTRVTTEKGKTKVIELEGLTREEMDLIEKDLRTYAPIIVTAMAAESDNPVDTGVFLNKVEKGYDNSEGNLVDSRAMVNGKLTTMTTGVLKREEVAPGVAGSAIHVQSSDAYVTSETVATTPSMNAHDSDIGGVNNYKEVATVQNKVFFDLAVNYRSQVETLNALIRPLNGFAVAIDKYGLQGHVDWKELGKIVNVDLRSALLEAGIINTAESKLLTTGQVLGALSNAKYQAEVNKIKSLQSLYAIHQYSGEGGALVLGKAEQDRLSRELEDLYHDQAESYSEMLSLDARLIESSNQALAYQARKEEATKFEQALAEYKGKEIPVDVMYEALEDALKGGDAIHAALFKTLKNILPEGLRFEYVNDDWQGAKNAAGWYNPKANKVSIRAVGSKTHFVTPELVLHELVHASLVSVTTNSHQHPQVKAAIDRIENLRLEVMQQLGGHFPEALVNKEEFMAWGLTNPEFQDALRSVIVTKGERNRNSWASAFKKFVKAVIDILFVDMERPKGKEISAIEALLMDSAEVIQYVQTQNPDRSYTPDRVFNMLKGANGILDQAKNMTPEDLLNSFSKGSISSGFNAHLEAMAKGPVTKLFDAVGKQHLDDLTIPVNYQAQQFASVYGLSPREEYIAEVVSVVVENTQDSAAYTPVMRELNRLYEDARARLKPEDFYPGDWSKASQAERSNAQMRYDLLFKAKVTNGASSHLSNFVGLAMGSEQFHNLLNYMPKQETAADRTLWQKTVDLVNQVVNLLLGALAGTRSHMKTNERLETLLDKLVKIDTAKRQSHASVFDRAWEGFYDFATGATGGGMTKLAEMITKTKLDQHQNQALRVLGKYAKVISRDQTDKLPELMKLMRDHANPNTRFGELAEIGNEIKSADDFKVAVEAYLRESVNVQNLRKNWIDITKRMSIENFANKGKDLTKDDHTALTYGVLRTDLHTLLDGRKFKEVMRYVDSAAERDYEIKRVIADVLRLDPNGNDMIIRAKDLGYYMVTGRSADGLVKNAYGIAQGVGTKYQVADGHKADNALIKALDDLASLYALEYSDPTHLDKVSALLKTEANRKDGGNGIEELMKLHKFAVTESSKDFKDNPYSQIKGYLPEITHTYRETLQAPLDDAKDLAKEGWELVSEISRDPLDTRTSPMALYMLRDGGVQRIVSGAVTFDATHAKGSTVTNGPTGSMTQAYRKALQSRMNVRSQMDHSKYDPRHTDSPRMVPSYDSRGNIIDFRYEMAAITRDEVLQRNNNFGDLLGAYVGNNVGREPMLEQNKKVLGALFDDFRDDYANNPRAYVSISATSTDPRLAEIWRMLPHELKLEAENLWGRGNPIIVRNDIVNLAFGFKKYSVAEMFDKAASERNWAEKTFVSILESLVGTFKPQERAKLYAVRGERFIQQVITTVKDIIVIRTASVLWGNIKSNALLLLAYGVNPIHLAKDTTLAVRAGLSYRKQRSLMIQAEEALRAGIGSRTKWEQQLVNAQNALARNPLREFIESGMMPSIVEDVELGGADYTYRTALQDKFEKQLNYVPKSARTAGKWLMLSHDTAPYKFLASATQLSDFTSKYVLYKHLTGKSSEPLSHADALQEASDAFINYDVPTSRGLQYLNDMGLMMFTKFFLRFQKVLFKLMRTRPAMVLSQHYATEWLTDTPGVLDPMALNQIGNPFHSSILQAPSAVTDIVTFKTLF